MSPINTPPTKIALLGYGSMGKELEKIASVNGCVIHSIFDENNPLRGCEDWSFDVAVDFSTADAVPLHLELLSQERKSVVIGTTGWIADDRELVRLAESSEIGIMVGSNFSVGLQMFLRTVQTLAALVNDVSDYDIAVNEQHHIRKVDSPSGTALTIAQTIVDRIDRKRSLFGETSHGQIEPTVLHVTSSRIGDVVGTHTVTADSPFDAIEITHRAKSRKGFATGAMKSARWIHHHRGFYLFENVFEEVLKAAV